MGYPPIQSANPNATAINTEKNGAEKSAPV
jgi:hypothetical protein